MTNVSIFLNQRPISIKFLGLDCGNRWNSHRFNAVKYSASSKKKVGNSVFQRIQITESQTYSGRLITELCSYWQQVSGIAQCHSHVNLYFLWAIKGMLYKFTVMACHNAALKVIFDNSDRWLMNLGGLRVLCIVFSKLLLFYIRTLMLCYDIAKQIKLNWFSIFSLQLPASVHNRKEGQN